MSVTAPQPKTGQPSPEDEAVAALPVPFRPLGRKVKSLLAPFWPAIASAISVGAVGAIVGWLQNLPAPFILAIAVLAAGVVGGVVLVIRPALPRRRSAICGARPLDEGEPLYGRTESLQDLVNLVSAASYRIGVVLGPAGSGKTSLVQAGLLSYLRSRDTTRARPVYLDIPDSADFDIASGLVMELHGDLTQPRDDAIRSRVEADELPVLVVLDHIEHLYAGDGTAAAHEALVHQLVKWSSQYGPHLRFLLCIRSEVFDTMRDLQADTDVLNPRNQLSLQWFTREEAHKAIIDMAGHDHFRLQKGLRDRLARDLSVGPSVSPRDAQLLLCQMRELRISKQHQYDRSGGSVGILGCYFHDTCFPSLNQDEEQPRDRRIAGVLSSLNAITASSDRGASLSDLCAQAGEPSEDEVRTALKVLVGAGLVVRLPDDHFRIADASVARFVQPALGAVSLPRQSPNPPWRAVRWGIGALVAVVAVGLLIVIRDPLLNVLPRRLSHAELQNAPTVAPVWARVVFDPVGRLVAGYPGGPASIRLWRADTLELLPLKLGMPQMGPPASPSFVPGSLAFDGSGADVSMIVSRSSPEAFAVWTWHVDDPTQDTLLDPAQTGSITTPDHKAACSATAGTHNAFHVALARDCGGGMHGDANGTIPPHSRWIDIYTPGTGVWQSVEDPESSTACQVASMAFTLNDDGLLLAYTCPDGTSPNTVTLRRDLGYSARPSARIEADGEIRDAVIGPHGEVWLVSQTRDAVSVYDWRTPHTPIYRVLGQASAQPFGSPDGQHLAIASGIEGVDVYVWSHVFFDLQLGDRRWTKAF